MKNWLRRFLAGRNGADELGRVLSLAGCVLVLVSMFVPGVAKTLLMSVAVVLLILCYFRMFSRNIYSRRLENQRWLQWANARKQALRQSKKRWQQRKDYRFYRCSQCRTWVRVPRGRGRIQITCPKCKSTFIRKS